MKRLDLTVMFYTLSMQLPLWPPFTCILFVPIRIALDQDVCSDEVEPYLWG